MDTVKEYHTIMWATQKPDCYAGETFDKMQPQWKCSSEGDQGDSSTKGVLTLVSNMFPAGTRITISVPVCPKCNLPNQQTDMRMETEPCECGFDWKSWAEHEFS